MNAFSLPINSASQSKVDNDLALGPESAPGIVVAHAVRIDRRLVAMIIAGKYPQVGTVQVDGLMPGRYYHLRGADHRFARADTKGRALIALVLHGPTELLVSPVI